jgi:hypothetical protein
VFGVIAEDKSDEDVFMVFLHRLFHNSTIPVKTKGFGGCGEMLRKGAKQLRAFADLGCKRFIICYDADGPNPKEHQEKIAKRIIKPSGIPGKSCLPLVPVQEIEAWLLADIHQAIPRIIPSWKPNPIPKPESIFSPKEHLENLSRGSNQKPRYAHTIHNKQVAKHLDFALVLKKCPSFRPLMQFVTNHRLIAFPKQPFPGKSGHAVWVYTGAGNGSRYINQLTTAPKWGAIINYAQNLDPQPENLTRLCEYGWCELEALEMEVEALVSKSKPKPHVRAILSELQALATNRGSSRFIGLDDGTA